MSSQGTMDNYAFEELEESHRRPVMDIFNFYIRTTQAAFPGEEMGDDLFDRFLEISQGYPRAAVKSPAGEVVGFAFLHPYHLADSFKRAAEIAYFFRSEHTRKGLGTAILDLFSRQCLEVGVDTILAAVSSRNPGSLAFHRRNGFRECGHFQRVGRKWGEDFDVIWMQKLLA